MKWFRKKDTPAEADLEGISALLGAEIGNSGPVLHEIASSLIHLDVLTFVPTPPRNTHLLVTCGMSALPMAAPDGEDRFLELCIELPSAWPLSSLAFKDERNYWPIRLLKDLGRYPHVHDTWLAIGHTIANGDPSKPYADNTRLCGAMIVPPVGLSQSVRNLPLGGNRNAKRGETAKLLQILPIHQHELAYKLSQGYTPLMERLVKALDGIGLQVAVDRPDCCTADRLVQ
jgi:hypothetical protein